MGEGFDWLAYVHNAYFSLLVFIGYDEMYNQDVSLSSKSMLVKFLILLDNKFGVKDVLS